jgi:hypothetical protein
MFYVTEVAKKHNIPFAIFFAILVFWITPALPRVFHLTHWAHFGSKTSR